MNTFSAEVAPINPSVQQNKLYETGATGYTKRYKRSINLILKLIKYIKIRVKVLFIML